MKNLIELKCLERLNLSYNDLYGLLNFLSGNSNLLQESLETLLLVAIDKDSRINGLTQWLLSNLPKLPNLYELEVSENSCIEVDVLL